MTAPVRTVHPERTGGLDQSTSVLPDLLDFLHELFAGERADEWQDRALCAQTDPEAFFPEKGASVREAKRTCQSCEVRTDCLEYALQYNERFGIWGGLSERERRLLRAARRDGDD